MADHAVIEFPDRFEERDIDKVLSRVSACPAGEPLCFDLSDVAWATPSLMTFVPAFGLSLAESGREVFLRVDESKNVFRYLQRMDFFKSCGIKTIESFKRHDPGCGFVTVQRVGSSARASKADDKLARDLAKNVHGADEVTTLPLLEYCFGELINNVVQHAMADGFVCGQYYPLKDMVHLSITDSGVGIRTSLVQNPKYLAIGTDEEAIRLALEPNVTGRAPLSTPYEEVQNAGNGLFFLSEYAVITRGMLTIYSGDCLIRLTQEGRIYPRKVQEYQGTIVGLRFSRKNVYNYLDMLGEVQNKRFGIIRSEGARFT